MIGIEHNNAYLEIKLCSNNTYAQDWAERLLRMYVLWCKRHEFVCEVLWVSEGDYTGIKCASIKVTGEYAYGFLFTETGTHRVDRKSPFIDYKSPYYLANRRYVSFANVLVSPEISAGVYVKFNTEDLQVDVLRTGDVGGQHVNRTNTAVRITHLPSNTVVHCQKERSQHYNRITAISHLRSKLFALEMGFTLDNRVRAYELDPHRIKDFRTGVTTGNAHAVLDGDLDLFIGETWETKPRAML